MKTYKIALSLLGSLAIFTPGKSSAYQSQAYTEYQVQEEAPVYYTRKNVIECEKSLKRGIVGGAIGGALGFIGNGLFNDGRNPMAPVAIGAAAGAAVGVVTGCNTDVVYVENHLSRRDYRVPYETERERVVVLESGYTETNQICRTYHSEYWTQNGWAANESTACWISHSNGRGYWQHGYPRTVIRRPVWRNDRPIIKVIYERPRRHHDRHDRHDRRDDRWGRDGHWDNRDNRRDDSWDRRDDRHHGHKSVY